MSFSLRGHERTCGIDSFLRYTPSCFSARCVRAEVKGRQEEEEEEEEEGDSNIYWFIVVLMLEDR